MPAVWESLPGKQCARQALEGRRWCAICQAKIEEALAKRMAANESYLLRLSTIAAVKF